MAIPYLLCVVAVLVLAFYIFFTWTFDYWSRHNVPFEPPTVFVGNMTFLLRYNMALFLRRVYKKFEGHDYFGIWIFRNPTLVVRSPEMAREVLVTKFTAFIDRGMQTHESDTLGAKCLLIAKGEHWTRLRHRLSPAFTRAKIRNILMTRMPAIIKELHEHIDHEYAGKSVDVKSLYMKYVLEVIAGNIFGIKANSMQDNNAPFLKLGMSFVDWTVLRGLEFSSIFLFPNLVDIFRFKLFTRENNDYMRTLFVKILASRELDKPELKAQSRDVVDALLQLKNGTDFTDDDVLAQAGLFFFAGFETTSTVLSLMSYELAFNQEFQDTLYKTIMKIQVGKTELDLDAIDDLKLLDMAVKETLRKYPTLPYADRMCSEDCELSNGLVVKKGTRVLICTSGLHFDEKYYPEPDQWNPYRFENEKDIVPFTYMPFSEGQRICIGAKFAMLIMKWTMASLLERYRLVPCADTVPPENLVLSPYTILGTADGPIKLNFIPR